MKRVSIATAAALAAVVLFLLTGIPAQPRTIPLDGVAGDLVTRTIRGSYHVHTSRSDGAEDKSSVAAAAARARLQFVIFTDHGDGTRVPDPPEYINGVLCLDGVEISTNHGHYIALGLPRSPYPLGGDAAAVVEDVARLGGLGIAAHPFHPNPELSWTDWTLPIDGIEWVNADVEWRNESTVGLLRASLAYLLRRPAAAVASVFDRPTEAMARWDQLSVSRKVLGLAGADAHGSRMGGLEEGKRTIIPGPSYEASFRTMTNRIVLDRPLSGDPAQDAAAVLDALRAGRVYVVVDGIGDGILLSIGKDGFEVASKLPSDAEVRVVRSGDRRRLEIDLANAPGRPPMPWVVGNWTGSTADRLIEEPAVAASEPIAVASEWRVEKDPSSSGEVAVQGDRVNLRYALGAGDRHNQFVASVADLPAGASWNRITVGGRAADPMRVSVQLRFAPDDRRWVKSIYLDDIEREVTFDVGQMHAADLTDGAPPPTSPRSLLFVVDLVNAKPGSRGEFSLAIPRADRSLR